jgi:hypothetical protein
MGLKTMMRYVLPGLVLLLTMASAWAEIYECVDPNGSRRFTNIKAEAKGCKVLDIGPINTVPAPRPSAKLPAPSNFPAVDASTQRARDTDRRRILEQELANEQKLLATAQRELAEQQSIRPGEEPNERVLDRLEPYKKKVRVHENNVESLRRELANLR